MLEAEISAPDVPLGIIARLGKHSDEAIAAATLKCAQYAEGQMRRLTRNTFKPGTGNLSKSFGSTFVRKDEEEISAIAFNSAKYARVQNEGSFYLPGGVIRSSRGPGKMLAYPLERRTDMLNAREVPNLRIALGKNANPPMPRLGLVLVNSTNKIVFNLARKVRIKATNFVEKAADKSQPEFPRIFDEELTKFVKKTSRKK